MNLDRGGWLGQSVERVEDAALLTGRGRYMDDLALRTDALHAAFLRSPHGHADILSIDVSAASALPGVVAVITGADLLPIIDPWSPAFALRWRRAPWQLIACATSASRWLVAIATDRYIAEDALDLIEVEYRQRPAVVDPEAALAADAPLLARGGRQQSGERAPVHLRRSQMPLLPRPHTQLR